MTTATFYHNDNEYAAHIKGHADYSTGGHDIVCAACSILCYTLGNAVLCEDTRIAEVRTHSSEGDFYIFVRCKGDTTVIDTIFNTVQTGFDMLQEQYSKNVNVRKTGEKPLFFSSTIRLREGQTSETPGETE